MIRTKRHLALGSVALLVLGGAHALSGRGDSHHESIRITARMFEYRPERIELRTGKPVTLELVSLDRLHGFHIPDLNLRADVPPGHSVQLVLVPEQAGTYAFLCDIFCGDGHDEMSGVIVVKD